MSKRKNTLRSNLVSQGATISIAAVFLAGCSAGVERFGDEYVYTGSTNNQRSILANGGQQPSYQDIVNGTGGTEAGLPTQSSRPLTTGSIGSAPRTTGSVRSEPLPALSPSAQTGQPYNIQPQAGLAPVRSNVQTIETMAAPEVAASQPVQTRQTVQARQPVQPASSVATSQGVASLVNSERTWKGWTSAGGTKVSVRKGDTLHSMSRRFGVPVKAVAAVNGIEDASMVRPGQNLIIPTYVYTERNGSTSAPAGGSRPVSVAQTNVPSANRKPISRQQAASTPVRSVGSATYVAALPPHRPETSIITGSVSRQTQPGTTRTSQLIGNSSANAPSKKPYRQLTFAELQARQNSITDASPVVSSASKPKMKPAGIAQAATQTQAQTQMPAQSGPNRFVSVSGKVPTPQPMPKVSGSQKVVAAIQPIKTGGETQKSAKPTAPIQVSAPAQQAPTSSNPMFRWPVNGRVISEFGTKPGGELNEGVNVAVPEGTPVKAADTGTVIYSGNELKGYGNLVLVRHENGWVSAYAHNSRLNVKRGDTVRRGDVIANSGATGSVSSPQVHFELRKGNKPVDPMQYLPRG
ncbi:MAG: peptidoglycan DD-metalloendopeptidase family protein [Rhodobacteraceae bacterium]|nr:peptidoglycan DD-metalloendopeptidase family protein [Paracoccaceae bacterium]